MQEYIYIREALLSMGQGGGSVLGGAKNFGRVVKGGKQIGREKFHTLSESPGAKFQTCH